MYQTHRFSLGQAGQGLGQVPEWHFFIPTNIYFYFGPLTQKSNQMLSCHKKEFVKRRKSNMPETPPQGTFFYSGNIYVDVVYMI